MFEQVDRDDQVLDAVAEDRVLGDAVGGLPGQAQADHQRDDPAPQQGGLEGLVPMRTVPPHPEGRQSPDHPQRTGGQARAQRHRPDLPRRRPHHMGWQSDHEVGVAACGLHPDGVRTDRLDREVTGALDGVTQCGALERGRTPAAADVDGADLDRSLGRGRVQADLGDVAQRLHIDHMALPDIGGLGVAREVQPLAEMPRVVGQVELVGTGALDAQVKGDLQVAVQPGVAERQHGRQQRDKKRPENLFARGWTRWLFGERLLHA